MKAVVYEKYGTPEVLELKEVERPEPKADEVLVKVHAASVNSWDWDRLTGKPYLFRLISGISKPKLKILGCDISGTVVETGPNISKFQPGDEVFGDISEGSWGGFAEYVCARENALTMKPASLSHENAAAIPQAGLLAFQGLNDKRKISPGEKVLINGAGGGVGTMAVQIAKWYGAEITAVDSNEKLGMLQSLGADHVIDYQKEDFTRNGRQYDLILDVTANRSVLDYRRALKPNGHYIMIGGKISAILQIAFFGTLISKMGNKKIDILAHHPNKDMELLLELIETGKVKPVIDRCYKLHEIRDAMQCIGVGKAIGKLVITI
jgi:NADPH:quinone reductase-like Zn-dependent oxidoreductase